MKKILLLTTSIYLLTLQLLYAENHRWYAGDYARVVSMWETSNVLEVMADLLATDTKEDRALADTVWLSALQSGECVFDGNYNYVVQLTEKLQVYPDLYGDDQNGELWQATVLLPTGRLVIVYVGMLERKAPDGKIEQGLRPSLSS